MKNLAGGCGNIIVYYANWSNIPNYCKDCKAKFDEGQKNKELEQEDQGSQNYILRFNYNTGKNDFYFGSDNPNPKDGYGHVVTGEDEQVHYVRDQRNLKIEKKDDAVSYDDGIRL